ncbi:MAG TPA: DUF3830 family protein [Candidatus Limnocylindrales bacterium]|nr:DUF3830 family protein [Candidatus Limnocylindrales bacterium]
MKEIAIEVDGVVGLAELLESNAPKAAAAFWASLPIATTLTHTQWSGRACGFSLDGGALQKVGLEHPVCSLYPGTLGVHPERGEALLSYGPSEYRSELGPEYLTRVARVTGNREALLAVLSRMHDEGDKRITLRRNSG